MNKLRRKTIAAAGLAVLFAGALLLLAPAMKAASGNYGTDDCTFCSSYVKTCTYFSGHTKLLSWQTCWRRLSGSGDCPDCTPCNREDSIILN